MENAPGSLNGARNIVVVGASAGGPQALKTVCSGLAPDLPAAIFVVCHRGNSGTDGLVRSIGSVSPLACREALDGEPVRTGQILVAPPDRHLLIKDEKVLLRAGPLENRARPAIDPLFRSAAATFGSRVTGIVLTGYLDDGTAGLQAVQRCGGMCIVQDPSDAAVPEMPSSAIEQMDVDHVLPAARIAELLNQLVRQPAPQGIPIPRDIQIEADIAAGIGASIATEEMLGDSAEFSCPDCGGVLWRIQDGELVRYRCHTGHGYTQDILSAAQTDTVEYALWAALRALREKVAMLERLSASEEARDRRRNATRFSLQAKEYRREAQRIQDLLVHSADHHLAAAE